MEEDIKLLEKINITTYGTKEELEIDLSEEELNQIIKNLINKYKEQEKIIDLMAKDIVENKLDEDICIQVKNLKKIECYACTYDGKDCSDCVIEYYEKKAKGE